MSPGKQKQRQAKDEEEEVNGKEEGKEEEADERIYKTLEDATFQQLLLRRKLDRLDGIYR